jgi:arsenate reductase
MEEKRAVDAFAALSQETRLRIVRLLVGAGPNGLAAGQIGQAVGASSSNVSFHLAQLEHAGLVTSRREARSIIYSASVSGLSGLVGFLLRDCCGGRPELCAPAIIPSSLVGPARQDPMPPRVFNVLFLCTGNSARSIMAEVILNRLGNGRFQAHSAGSQPRGQVNRFAIRALEGFGFPTDGLRSKSWEEFAAPDAPEMDFVFTVCDSAAGEICPVWPGQPISAHWGIEDPALVEGADIVKEAAFVQAAKYLRNRISAFAALPVGSLDGVALNNRLRAIGAMDGASSGLRLAAQKDAG